MNEEKKADWQHGGAAGQNKSLHDITMGLARLHRITIESKLAEMKAFVSAECAKLNHPTATEFADEINKLKVE